jgi:hypothetical protein
LPHSDVPPIKGVDRGALSVTRTAGVTVRRIDGVDPAAIARS